MKVDLGRCSLQCIIPPYITEKMAESPDAKIRRRALANIAAASSFRTQRRFTTALPTLMANISPDGRKHRLVYDARKTNSLPGTLVRGEGDAKSKDVAANEAYDASGTTYDFYDGIFQRKSLDDQGMSLISSVHVTDDNGEAMDNAFWNGEQMAYGDGDDLVFTRFTKSLDVVGHELTHGVQAYTSNLQYFGQSGALNEHFSDVFGVLVRQWKDDETANLGSWLIGEDILIKASTRKAVRDMENPGTAFSGDPIIGSDPQPSHMDHFYSGQRDRGGVHVNSGIPNRAFVLFAKALGGKAWETAGHVWYEALLRLDSAAQFGDCAQTTIEVAGKFGAAAKKAAKAAWNSVGL